MECDKCHSEIIENDCSCGKWGLREDFPDLQVFEESILTYNILAEKNNDLSPFTGDHYSGTCFVFFKGDYKKLMIVKEFINEISKN